MAALFSVVLVVLFYSHAGAASATTDLKLNGMDHMATLMTESTFTAAVQSNDDEQVENGSYPVVDTGQTACYDDNGDEITCPESGEDFAGQDAQYDGNQMSYSDNGDGTITDNTTGLMWQQTPGNTGLSWQDAVDDCESLILAGYDDWRIPTLKELFSISDFAKGWPYLNTTYFDIAGTSVSKDEQYWADYYVGTTVEGGSAAAFGVNHGTGHIKAYPAGASGPMGNYVRAVRGNTYGVNDFVDNGDGTITDNATGLMWQQADSGSGLDWENALAYAETSTLARHNDWRLPNVKELQSIVDYTRSPSAGDAANLGPAIDTDFFQITELPSGTTNYSPDYGYFWSSTSAYFGTNSPEYYYAWYVAFGTAVDDDGNDMHGAGAVRFDTKVEGGPLGEGGERYYNYVRLVRDAGSTQSTDVYVDQNDDNCDGNSPCYSTIQAGIDVADDGSTVNVAHGTYTESLSLNSPKKITLKGGWNDHFSDQDNTTVIKAPKVEGGGTLTMQDIVIRP